MLAQRLHHVAYRCADAKETVDFYTRVLGFRYVHAIRNDYVPSIREYSPHLHIFFEMADGSYVAFFEVPQSPPMQFDPNTPRWVQHLALEVKDEAALDEARARLERHGVAYVGPTDHGFIRSIYFFDPSGHRLEFAYRCDKPGDRDAFAATAPELLQDWVDRKR